MLQPLSVFFNKVYNNNNIIYMIGFTTNFFLKINFKWTMLSGSRMAAILGDTDRKADPLNSPEDKPRG